MPPIPWLAHCVDIELSRVNFDPSKRKASGYELGWPFRETGFNKNLFFIFQLHYRAQHQMW